jgi:hypothetical protein
MNSLSITLVLGLFGVACEDLNPYSTSKSIELFDFDVNIASRK